MPSKSIESYLHTETVFYNDDGEEIGRFDNHDAHWWDTESAEDITDEELAEEWG